MPVSSCRLYSPYTLAIFGCLLLSLLTDKLQSRLSSVCWPEAASSPSCQSGRPGSSDRLPAAIRWLVAHSFLSYTLKILKTSSNSRAWKPVKCQMWLNFSLGEFMSEGHLPHKQGFIYEKKQTVEHNFPYALFNSTI